MNSQFQVDDQLNTGLIRFNQLLLEAHNYFQLRDMNNSVKYYELALEEPEARSDPDKVAIIQTNLGIIKFHNCDYKGAQIMLLDALAAIDRKNEFKCALIVKILGNLSIIKLVMTEYQQCKDYNEQAIKLIMASPVPLRYQLFKELMYIYFRFTSFEAMGDGNFENLEQKYDGASLACFYSSMGLNRELNNDPNLALKYHKKALQIWVDIKENGFIVITLRRLIQICQQLSLDVKEYVNQLHKFMQTPDLKGISPDVLFKDCEKKLSCARDITNSLKKVEDSLNQQRNQELLSKPLNVQSQDDFWKLAVKLRIKRAIQHCYSLLSQQPQNQEPLHQSICQLQHTLQVLDTSQPYENFLQNLPFTKDSIKVVTQSLQKLNRVILRVVTEPFFYFLFNTLQYQNQPNTKQQKLQPQPQMFLQQEVKQGPYSYDSYPNDQQFNSQQDRRQLAQLQNGQGPNPASFQSGMSSKNQQFQSQQQQLQQLQNQSQRQEYFNSQAQQQDSRSQKQTIQNQILQGTQQQAITPRSQINSQRLNQSQVSNSMTKSMFKNTQLLNGAYRVAQIGDYLVKCNKNTNGRIQRYFQLGLDNTFRWAPKDIQINDPNKVNFYLVSEIRGLLYGKCTEVLRKSYNKELEPWLCFSLLMKTRSMDFYLNDRQIDFWVIALSTEIQRKNSKAFVLSVGNYYWRKLKWILDWHFVGRNKNMNKKKARFTFVKLICLFNRNGKKLPTK